MKEINERRYGNCHLLAASIQKQACHQHGDVDEEEENLREGDESGVALDERSGTNLASEDVSSRIS